MSNQSESQIQSAIRLALGQRDDVMLFRINVGKFRPLNGPQNRVIQSAPPGVPDLLGVWKSQIPKGIMQKIGDELRPSTLALFLEWLAGYGGTALAIEVKDAKGKQRPEQVAFQKAWEARGGIYILARSVEDVIRRIDDEQKD